MAPRPTRRAKLSACSKLEELVDLNGDNSDSEANGSDIETSEEEVSQEDYQMSGDNRVFTHILSF